MSNHNEYWSEARRREIVFTKRNGARDRGDILEAIKKTTIVAKDLDFSIDDIPHKVFRDSETTTYNTEPCRLELGEFTQWQGRKVLEIGCGMGLDGMQFARGGAIYTGIDISHDEIEMAKRYFDLEGVKGEFLNKPIQECKFPDNCFDLVYSYGVLHHIPQMEKTIEEIYRVLRPNGKIIVMLYAKSLNYYLRVCFFMRLLVLFTYPQWLYRFLHNRMSAITRQWLGEHHKNIRKFGLAYLFSQNFINASTDRYNTLQSGFYSKKMARKLFESFSNIKMYKRHFPLFLIECLKWVPYSVEKRLGMLWGGFLYIKAYKPSP